MYNNIHINKQQYVSDNKQVQILIHQSAAVAGVYKMQGLELGDNILRTL